MKRIILFLTTLSISLVLMGADVMPEEELPVIQETIEVEFLVDARSSSLEMPTIEIKRIIPYYTIDGNFLGTELSDYLYDQLESRGVAYFYQIALCQLYHESRFKIDADNGVGAKGLGQIMKSYWEPFCEQAGLVDGDPYNPYDNIYVYAYLMSHYLDSTGGNIDKALSYYNVGNSINYNERYVNGVHSFEKTIKIMGGKG